MSIKLESNNGTLPDSDLEFIIEGDVQIRDEIQIQNVEDIIDNFSYYKDKCFTPLKI